MLVRTDPDAPSTRGITWLIMPMDAPGIDVRPIDTVLGSSEFSEMFLDEVRVPVGNRVGDENDGWRVAMVTFSFERGTAFVSELLASMELARGSRRHSQARHPSVGYRVGRRRHPPRDRSISAELDALWSLTKRNVSQAARTGVPGPGGIGLQAVLRGGARAAGRRWPSACSSGPRSVSIRSMGRAEADQVEERIYALSLRIAAGTSQIQQNIVGERVLGLPKER